VLLYEAAVGPLLRGQLPYPVRASVTAALDKLDGNELITLRVSAVFGEVSSKLLDAVPLSSAPPGRLSDSLPALVKCGLLVPLPPVGTAHCNVNESKNTASKFADHAWVLTQGALKVTKPSGGWKQQRMQARWRIAFYQIVFRKYASNTMTEHRIFLQLHYVITPPLELYAKGRTSLLACHAAEHHCNHNEKLEAALKMICCDGNSSGVCASGRGGNKEQTSRCTRVYCFASYVTQEVAYSSWGLEHRSEVHQTAVDMALGRLRRLDELNIDGEEAAVGVDAQLGVSGGRDAQTRTRTQTILQEAITSVRIECYAKLVHHRCMGELYEKAAAADKECNDTLGSEKLLAYCVEQVGTGEERSCTTSRLVYEQGSQHPSI
jgi:hypothetical protein